MVVLLLSDTEMLGWVQDREHAERWLLEHGPLDTQGWFVSDLDGRTCCTTHDAVRYAVEIDELEPDVDDEIAVVVSEEGSVLWADTTCGGVRYHTARRLP